MNEANVQLKLSSLFLIASPLLTLFAQPASLRQRRRPTGGAGNGPQAAPRNHQATSRCPALRPSSTTRPARPSSPFSVSRTLYPQVAACRQRAGRPAVAAGAGLYRCWSHPSAPPSTGARPTTTCCWARTTAPVGRAGHGRADDRRRGSLSTRGGRLQRPARPLRADSGLWLGRINRSTTSARNPRPAVGSGAGPQVLASTLGISTNHWVRIRMDGFHRSSSTRSAASCVHLDCPLRADLQPSPPTRTTLSCRRATWLDGDTATWLCAPALPRATSPQSASASSWALRNQTVRTNLLAKSPQLYGAPEHGRHRP